MVALLDFNVKPPVFLILVLNIFLYSDIYFPKLAVSFNFAFYLRHIVHSLFFRTKISFRAFCIEIIYTRIVVILLLYTCDYLYIKALQICAKLNILCA